MQTECNADLLGFARVEGRAVVAAFDGGTITSEAGAMLLGATDGQLRLIERFAGDPTEAVSVEIVQRDADDPAAGDETGSAQMEQSRQQPPSRQVTRGAHQNDDLGISRTDL